MDIAAESGLWALFASAFISATIAPGGSEVVLAYLVSRHEIPLPFLLLCATAGNTLGAMSTWLLGVLGARGYPVEKFTGAHHLRALRQVKRWGPSVLLLSWLPVVGDALCFAAGWLRLPFLPSLLTILIGKAARYAAVTVLASA